MSAEDELARAARDYAENQKAAVPAPVREEYAKADEVTPLVNLTGKSWANKNAREMTDDEINDAYATYRAAGSIAYEAEWLRRHGLFEGYDD